MDCPKCATTLAISDRHGIEIDYCPNCRGVWLDRQELDKIIEREMKLAGPAAPTPQSRPDRDDDRRRDRDDDRHDRDDDRHGRDDDRGGRRSKSWWTELFD